jgi:WD40 repeat protein
MTTNGAARGPYVGLTPYAEEDAPYFVGRERDQRVVVANLRAARITLLYGPSGVGKSSVLSAGVVPALREIAGKPLTELGLPQHVVVQFSSWGEDPEAALTAAVAEAVGAAVDDDLHNGRSLQGQLERCAERYDGEIFVLLDQFESYFVYHPHEQSGAAFPQALARAIGDRDLRVNFLLALREDALARLQVFKGLVPGLFDTRLLLERLSREAGREAIIAPLARYNALHPDEEDVTIEPALVDAVLEEVAAGRVRTGKSGAGAIASNGTEQGVEAPYLQLVMERLWREERERGSSLVRLSTLRELGGAEAIVREHLHGALDGLELEQRAQAAAMFEYLVTPSGTKIAQRASDLADYAHTTLTEIEAPLDALERARILRRVPAPDDPDEISYELFHDVLADAVLEWRLELEGEQRVERERRRRRRLVALLMGAFALVAIVAGIAVYAFIQRNEAEEQREAAEVQKQRAVAGAFAAGALSELSLDPELALRLALEAGMATPGKPTPQALEALRRALGQPGMRAVVDGAEGTTDVAASADGQRLATGQEDGTARVWQPSASETALVLRGHSGPVVSVQFSPDGETLLTASDDRTARLWDVTTGELLRVLEHPAAVAEAAFDRDGRLIATADVNGRVRIWSTASGKPVRTFRAGLPFSWGPTIAFGTGDRLAVALDQRLSLWDARSGTRIATFPESPEGIVSLAFSPSGRSIVAGSTDGSALLWRVRTRSLEGRLSHGGAVTSVAFSDDGRSLLTAGPGTIARVWQVKSRTQIAALPHPDSVVAAAIGRGREVATVTLDGSLRVWQLGVEDVQAIKVGSTGVRRVALSADGTTALAVSGNGTVSVLSIRADSAQIDRTLSLNAVDAAYDPTSDRIATASIDGTVEVRDRSLERVVATLPARDFLDPDEFALHAVAFSPDGMQIAVASLDGTGLLWNLPSGPVRRLETGGGAALAVDFDPGGDRLITTTDEGEAQIWDATTGGLIRAFRGPRLPMEDVDVSTEQRIVTASANGTAQLWNEEGEAGLRLVGHEDVVTSAAFSDDGSLVVTTGVDATARIWETSTGALISTLPSSGPSLLDAEFSADGRLIAAATSNGAVLLFTCRLCGGPAELMRLAEARHPRELTPAERERFAPGS